MSVLEEDRPTVSSNRNWTDMKNISSKFEERNSLPKFTEDNLLRKSRSKYSIMLLDGKMGLFLYNPLIKTFAISYSMAEYEDGKLVYLIKIRSWYLSGGRWFHFRDGTILQNGTEADLREEFPAASRYCRSLMIKLAKAESRNKFSFILARSNRICHSYGWREFD